MFESINFEEILRWLKSHWKWVLSGSLGLLALLATLILVLSIHKKEEPVKALPVLSQSSFVRKGEHVATTLKVDVKGAVRKPGLYQLKVGDRIEDALAKAGGVTDEADVNQLNRAQLLADGMFIYVLKVGEKEVPEVKNAGSLPGMPSSGNVGEAGTDVTTGKIHLNQASQKELESLTGIGPKKAEQIIAYREQHPFKSVDELKEIPGIGPKRFDQLKDQVQL